mmetsp:Transcript_15350/g.21016  ORF Transcript_15350/g.21016 Transcript_15350/m.21016 type:complete len:131 (+) Transcript_15350:136-528(+)
MIDIKEMKLGYQNKTLSFKALREKQLVHVLNNLVENGFLSKSGAGGSSRWTVAKEFVDDINIDEEVRGEEFNDEVAVDDQDEYATIEQQATTKKPPKTSATSSAPKKTSKLQDLIQKLSEKNIFIMGDKL